MSTQTLNYYEIVSQLPEDTVVTFHGAGWDDYEELLEQVGERKGLRISYSEGVLDVMTVSPEHENYADFIRILVAHVSFRLRINVRFFGSATIKKRPGRKGAEPDACFYVQSAESLGAKMRLDFAADPPPDIVVEVDIHHDSRSKFPIYGEIGVPEIWRFDGNELTIHLLERREYVQADKSHALPVLSAGVLTEFLKRLAVEGEFKAMQAFDEWLQTR